MKTQCYVTHVPNVVFDEYLKNLKLNELKILLAIIRQTTGYKLSNGKRKTRDWISTKRFRQLTGLSRRSISDGVKSLISLGVIHCTNSDGIMLHSAQARKGRQQIYYGCTLGQVQPMGWTSANSCTSVAQNLRSTNTYSTKRNCSEQKSSTFQKVGDILLSQEYPPIGR